MSLYTKYRPKKFDEFFGNTNTVESLRQALKKETLPSTMMFCGPTGCGKTTLARIVKDELKCSEANFNELNVANTRGIDTIREVITFSHYSTFDGSPRIFLFDEAHKLTPDAQNALLKILEDTPPKVYFILCTTEPQKLIETVRKRCVIYAVAPLSLLTIVTLLKKVCKAEGKDIPENVLREIARSAEGLPRQALLILDQVINLKPEIALEMIKEIEIGVAELIDICRLLVKRPKPKELWKEVVVLIKNLEITEPEKARVAVMNYLTTTFLNTEDERFGNMMQYFSEPCINAGRGGFVLALWKASKEIVRDRS